MLADAMPVRAFLPAVIAELAGHGIRPRPGSDPERVRALLNDLYRIQLRRVRDAVRSGAGARSAGRHVDHGARVRALRDRYRLLALPTPLWLAPEAAGEPGAGRKRERR